MKINRRDTLRMAGLALGMPFWERFAVAQGALSLTPVADNLMVLMGAGGNITVLRSPDGLLVLDSGLVDSAPAMMAKLKEAGPGQIRQLINTHWHSDHTGGNPTIGSTGVPILAHENCAKRVSETQHMMFFKREVKPLPAEGQPKEVFGASKHMQFGGESLACKYFPPAHTDGDITVHFQKADVYSTGDLFFNNMYPFIDYSSGGSIEGMISNSGAILKEVGSKTKIVPGHGPVGTKAELEQFHDMLADLNQQISGMVSAGKTAEEITAAAPTKKYDAQFGNGFLKPAAWVGMICQGKMQKS